MGYILSGDVVRFGSACRKTSPSPVVNKRFDRREDRIRIDRGGDLHRYSPPLTRGRWRLFRSSSEEGSQADRTTTPRTFYPGRTAPECRRTNRPPFMIQGDYAPAPLRPCSGVGRGGDRTAAPAATVGKHQNKFI